MRGEKKKKKDIFQCLKLRESTEKLVQNRKKCCFLETFSFTTIVRLASRKL